MVIRSCVRERAMTFFRCRLRCKAFVTLIWRVGNVGLANRLTCADRIVGTEILNAKFSIN